MVNKTVFCSKTIAYTSPSHSIVAGGFPEMSYTTREIPGTDP